MVVVVPPLAQLCWVAPAQAFYGLAQGYPQQAVGPMARLVRRRESAAWGVLPTQGRAGQWGGDSLWSLLQDTPGYPPAVLVMRVEPLAVGLA